MKTLLIAILIITANLAKANPNMVINVDAHYDSQYKLVTPDKFFLTKALKAYQDGYNKSALKHFRQAAAFGNSDAQMYIGLMYIKSLGVDQNWSKGYAWIRLSAQDGSKKHVDLKKNILGQLKPDEKKQAEIDFLEISNDYSTSATLKRRNRWVRKQKMKSTGSRTGSQTTNVQSQALNGVKLDNNRSGRLNEMEAFVNNYNFGVVTSGEITPIEAK
jgi:TPR repeat protein